MIRSTLLAALLFATFSAQAAEPAAKPKDIDLVLCLDVSGSMNGLIDSAKLRLWDIVNELAKVKPVPNLRVSLYAYGSPGFGAATGYVRKEIDLTTDLDAVYAKLNALRIGGGAEYCARVSTAAVKEQKWSEDDGALKIIFVCGNEPAGQDPVITIDEAVATAKKSRVIINTIYCGNADNDEAKGWSDFASKGGGKYANIDQNKAKSAAVSTPFDKDLAELSTKLNGTYVMYGKGGDAGAKNQAAQDSNAAGAAPAAAAARAVSKAEGLYRNSGWDLVDKLKDDPKFDINTIKDEDLCEEMRKLKPAERLEYLKKKGEERAEIRKTIGAMAQKRQAHLDEEAKKTPKTPGEVALDEALKTIIREQAASKGFEVKK